MYTKTCTDIHVQALVGTELKHLWHQFTAPGLLGYDATLFTHHTLGIFCYSSLQILSSKGVVGRQPFMCLLGSGSWATLGNHRVVPTSLLFWTFDTVWGPQSFGSGFNKVRLCCFQSFLNHYWSPCPRCESQPHSTMLLAPSVTVGMVWGW